MALCSLLLAGSCPRYKVQTVAQPGHWSSISKCFSVSFLISCSSAYVVPRYVRCNPWTGACYLLECLGMPRYTSALAIKFVCHQGCSQWVTERPRCTDVGCKKDAVMVLVNKRNKRDLKSNGSGYVDLHAVPNGACLGLSPLSWPVDAGADDEIKHN